MKVYAIYRAETIGAILKFVKKEACSHSKYSLHL